MKIRTDVSKIQAESINHQDDLIIFIGDDTEICVHSLESLIIEDSENPDECRFISSSGFETSLTALQEFVDARKPTNPSKRRRYRANNH